MASSTSPSSSIWSEGIAVGVSDFAFAINWRGGIAIYDICDNNHTYVVYFTHAKEFLRSIS